MHLLQRDPVGGNHDAAVDVADLDGEPLRPHGHVAEERAGRHRRVARGRIEPDLGVGVERPGRAKRRDLGRQSRGQGRQKRVVKGDRVGDNRQVQVADAFRSILNRAVYAHAGVTAPPLHVGHGHPALAGRDPPADMLQRIGKTVIPGITSLSVTVTSVFQEFRHSALCTSRA